MERIAYKGWENCYELSNGLLRLIVTADVGPRVLHFGLIEGENEFYENAAYAGLTGGDTWRNYGGHRLWHAPELVPRTYAPDNSPVTVEDHGAFARFIQPVELTTGIQKEMDLRLFAGEAHVQVTHRLRNTTLWDVELAPWALSVMAPGGTAIAPLPPRASHDENLQPTGAVILWGYTDMTDPRWCWGRQLFMLRQVPGAAEAQKAGGPVPAGWVAYARGGRLFVKTFRYQAEAQYPDSGCAVEVFTNGAMLEVETLGPLVTLPAGGEVEHVEHWFLLSGIPVPASESDALAQVVPAALDCCRAAL